MKFSKELYNSTIKKYEYWFSEKAIEDNKEDLEALDDFKHDSKMVKIWTKAYNDKVLNEIKKICKKYMKYDIRIVQLKLKLEFDKFEKLKSQNSVANMCAIGIQRYMEILQEEIDNENSNTSGN